MRTLNFIVWLTTLLFCSQAMAAHICWIEKVQRDGEVLHVFMRSGYEGAARSVARTDGTSKPIVKAQDGSFELLEGEKVFLSTLPHDVCTGTAAKKSDKLGVMLETSTCTPGIGCMQSSDFVVDN